MIASLALVFLIGLFMAEVCSRLKVPRIIGMLVTGVVLGPCALDLLDPALLAVSAELRQIALIIILIKAGITLNVADLKKVGRPAVLMSCLPAVFEIAAFVLIAPSLLGIDLIDGAVMGAVLGAVSPAVVVPRMVSLIESGYGTEKGVPQLILAGASLDDVFVIVLFSTFVGMAQGDAAKVTDFLRIPLSVLTGVLLGAVAGLLLAWLFELSHKRGRSVRNSMKTLIILGTAFLLTAVETWLEGTVPVSGLLAVMSMACAVRSRCRPCVGAALSGKFGKLWLAAEVLLFVLVGAAVNVPYTLKAGPSVLLMIAVALVFRSAGVWLCLIGTKLTVRERLYCVIAYLPKATVQAAIGSVPLSLGLSCGSIVLSAAVLSIVITAPLGAFGMDLSYRKLLTRQVPAQTSAPQ